MDTGLLMAVPDGYYGGVAPISGLATKQHIDIGVSAIYKDYSIEVGIVVLNHSEEKMAVNMGECIAHIIL